MMNRVISKLDKKDRVKKSWMFSPLTKITVSNLANILKVPPRRSVLEIGPIGRRRLA